MISAIRFMGYNRINLNQTQSIVLGNGSMNNRILNDRAHRLDCTCIDCISKRLNSLRTRGILEERDRQQQDEAKKEIARIDASDKGGIVGNERWNPKKGRYESLGKPKILSSFSLWKFLLVLFILAIIYIVIALIINYYDFYTTWHIFIW
jgi:hypothetical protein